MTEKALQADLRRLLKLALADAAYYGEQATALSNAADSLEAVAVAHQWAVEEINRLRRAEARCRLFVRDAQRRAGECRAACSPVDLSRQPGAST